MFKKLILHLWQSRAQFVKYAVTGCSAFVLDMGTLTILTDMFKFDAVVAVALNQVFIIAYVFFFNKIWSFKAQGETRSQAIRFFMVMGFNYLVAIIWMWWWHKYFGYNDKLVRVSNIILSTSWNFLLYKHFVYRK